MYLPKYAFGWDRAVMSVLFALLRQWVSKSVAVVLAETLELIALFLATLVVP